MSVAGRAVIGWLALFVVMFANGFARVLLLQPPLGEDRARQVASATGLVLALLVSWVFVRMSDRATLADLRWVGLAWLAATLAFEFLFGHYVSGQPWEALLADYNIMRGRLWLLVLIGVAAGPWLAGVLQGRT